MGCRHAVSGDKLKLAVGKLLLHHVLDGCFGGTDGAAAVKLSFKTGKTELQLAEHQRQLAGLFILNVHAHSSTVVVAKGEQASHVTNRLLTAGLGQRQVCQHTHHGDLGILAPLGRCSVSADAQGMNMYQAVFFSSGELHAGLFLMLGTDSLNISQSQTFHISIALTSDDIGSGSAMDGSHPGQCGLFFPLGTKNGLVAALFNVDDGIFRIRRETDGRRGLLGQIISQIFAAGLLSAAQNDAAALGQVGIQLTGSLCSPQCHNSRSFVIGRAAAIDAAILNGTLIGREGPAGTFTDNVHMGQNTQIGLFIIHFGADHIIVKVLGSKAHFLCQLLALHQRIVGAFAKGHAGFGRLALTLDANQAANICNHLLLLVGKIGFDFFFVHNPQTPSKLKGGVYSSLADRRSWANPEKPSSAARSATLRYS